MGVWLTPTELRARFGGARINGLSDRDRDGQPDPGVIDEVIARAEGRALSRLLTRYSPTDLPTTPETTGSALKRVVGGFAYYYLNETSDVMGAEVLSIQADAKGELNDLAGGGSVLGLADEPTVDIVRPAILASHTVDDARMSREALKDW